MSPVKVLKNWEELELSCGNKHSLQPRKLINKDKKIVPKLETIHSIYSKTQTQTGTMFRVLKIYPKIGRRKHLAKTIVKNINVIRM